MSRVALLVSLLVLWMDGAASAQTQLTSAPRDIEWVAVTVANGAIVMATRALPRYGFPLFKGDPFRVRFVPLPRTPEVISVALSADGTQLSVAFQGGRRVSVDLTRQVLEVGTVASDPVPFEVLSPAATLTDAALTTFTNQELATRFLVASNLPPTAPWQLYRPREPDETRYSPVLHLLQEERVLPSAFDVWEEILQRLPAESQIAQQPKSRAARQELVRAYDLVPRSCSIYFRKRPFPGSWLLEYWMYYPLDYGFNGHLHDSEHIFVEVDRLGGSVRRVAGAGHGLWAANSIYHTFSTDIPPVTLPLHGLVELGKHATAPDINHDGVFTPGVDSNIHWDTAKVWGVRDTTGSTDSSYRQFDGTMAVPRSADTLRRTLVANKAPSVPPGPNTPCELIPLPGSSAPKPSSPCANPLSADCARHHVMDNGDARNPDGILKPAAFPRQYLRVGTAFQGGRTSSDGKAPAWGQAFVGFGFELQSLKVAIPGRVYAQVSPTTRILQPRRFAVSYERLQTNLFGYYLGVSGERRLAAVGTDKYSSLLHGGMLVELSLPSRWMDGLGSGLNFHGRVGVNSDGKSGIGLETQFGLGITYGSLFRKFGIRSSDPNPY